MEPARVVSPGEVIAKELEARRWAQRDLAMIMGLSNESMSAIIDGKAPITPNVARALGEAFGTSVDFWLNLEANYRKALP